MTQPIPDRSDLPRVSVIVPVLNEREQVEATWASVSNAVDRAPFPVEVIWVDGGSSDGSLEWLESRPETRVMHSRAGRATQMNAGAAVAQAPWLCFLHADTHLLPHHFELSRDSFTTEAGHAFAFELEYRNDTDAYRRMERGVVWRTRTFGLPYGDQAICVPRAWFQELGGFHGPPCLEDVDLVCRLFSLGVRFKLASPAVRTSARQYEHQGLIVGILYNLGRLTGSLCTYFLCGEHQRLRRNAAKFKLAERTWETA